MSVGPQLASPTDPNGVPAIVPVQFWTDYENDPDNPGQLRGVDWVRWVKKGQINGATTEDKVSRVQKHNRAVWSVIEPYYAAWKRNEDAPVNGTPLDAAPFLTREQTKVFATYHVKSVEDLAALEDGALNRIGLPGIRGIQTKARAYLQALKGDAAITAALASRDEQIASQKAELEELRRTVEQLASQAGRTRRAKPGDVAEAQG